MRRIVLVTVSLLSLAFTSQAGAFISLEATGIINNAWSLMTIDQSSGVASQVGSLGGAGITAAGFAILPATSTGQIPEPTTFIVWSLLGLSAGVISYRRNSRA